MKNSNYDNDISEQFNAEYVVLQTGSMNMINKSTTGKVDNLITLLQESDSVTNFRCYLDSINSGHFLDFWFACQGFKNFDKSDSHKFNQLTKVIYRAYIKSESPFAVPLKSNTKKLIVDKLSDRKSFDPSIFDTAQTEIRDILAGEFLIKFYKSEFYTDTTMFDRNSLSSSYNNPQINDVPVSSSSSTGYISRRFIGAKHLATSKSYEAVTDGNLNIKNQNEHSVSLAYTAQNTGTVTSGFNNGSFGVNGGSASSKDRRNLSEVDPPAFAKILTNKLEEIFVEQAKFDRILRLVKSFPNESDTDDSHSSAISYLMKCQMYSPHAAGKCCSLDGDVAADTTSCKTKLPCHTGDSYSTEIKDDYAQDILENHCSRIGIDRTNDSRHAVRRDCSESRRDNSEIRSKWKRETDLGSITSYDSGVATSLEQYSNMGIPHHLLDTILQLHKTSSKNVNSIDLDSHRYHHHHHHHHHPSKNHVDYTPHKNFPTVYNISDVSSNIDSGVSSAYEHLAQRLQPKDDKVSNWMSKNPQVTSNTCYNFHDSFFPNNTSEMIPPNTPLISSRGTPLLPTSEIYPNQSYVLSRCFPNKICSPLPESNHILPCQSIEHWLEQQGDDSCQTLSINNIQSRRHNYCSSTIGVAGSELVSRDDHNFSSVQQLQSRDKQKCHQLSKPKPAGPLVVGYYIGNDPVPYRTQIPDAQHITLGQFKALIAKKGPYRYFFKRYCDEFECGVVHEEISKDDSILPLWEGKVVAKIEKSD